MTNFSFEFFYQIFTEDAPLPLLYHGAKKSKMTKNSNQGVSCLKLGCYEVVKNATMNSMLPRRSRLSSGDHWAQLGSWRFFLLFEDVDSLPNCCAQPKGQYLARCPSSADEVTFRAKLKNRLPPRCAGTSVARFFTTFPACSAFSSVASYGHQRIC